MSYSDYYPKWIVSISIQYVVANVQFTDFSENPLLSIRHSSSSTSILDALAFLRKVVSICLCQMI